MNLCLVSVTIIRIENIGTMSAKNPHRNIIVTHFRSFVFLEMYWHYHDKWTFLFMARTNSISLTWWWWSLFYTRPTLWVGLYNASSLTQQSTDRHLAPFWYIISSLCLFPLQCWVLCEEYFINFIVFGFTRAGFETMIYRTNSEHSITIIPRRWSICKSVFLHINPWFLPDLKKTLIYYVICIYMFKKVNEDVYSIHHYAIQCVSDMRQDSGFLHQ